MNNSKKEYQAPELTVVEVKTEHGYASSYFSVIHPMVDDFPQGDVEDYTINSGWQNDNNNSFWGTY